MMLRLLSVTSGYLRFTLACMLASTAAFFMAGLAITAPRLFLLFLALSAAAFLLVRVEMKSHRQARELSRKNDPKEDIKALIEYLAFAEATSMVISGINDQIKIKTPSLWISEWHHTDDPTTILDGALMDTSFLEKAEIATAIKDLQHLEGELAEHGLYILSVSKMPAEQVVKSIQQNDRRGVWSQIFLSHHGASNLGRPLSIVFLHDTGVPFRVEVVQKLLQTSFQMVRAGIDLRSK